MKMRCPRDVKREHFDEMFREHVPDGAVLLRTAKRGFLREFVFRLDRRYKHLKQGDYMILGLALKFEADYAHRQK